MTRTSLFLVGSLVLAACDGTFRFDQQPADAGAATAQPCRDSSECHGLRCNRGTGLCVACTDDDDCSGARPRCDGDLQVCVECRADDDCASGRRCETTTHRCIETCTSTCPKPGYTCEAGLCIECTNDANCAASASGPVCDTAIGRCVECTSNAHCKGGAAVCDRRSGDCAVCVSSSSCSGGLTCDPTRLVCRVP